MRIRELMLMISLLMTLESKGVNYSNHLKIQSLGFKAVELEKQSEQDKIHLPLYLSGNSSGVLSNSDFTYTDTCQFSGVIFSNFYPNPDSIHWSFDDPLSGPFNFATSSIIQHFFINPGNYSIQCIVFANNTSDTTIKDITIVPLPAINLGTDTSLCKGATLLLTAGTNPAANYLWQDGTTLATYTATTSQNYVVTVTEYGCSSTDSIKITFTDVLIFPTTDSTICSGSKVFLDVTNSGPGFSFQWNDGYPTPFRFIDTDGIYIATVSLGSCTKSSTYTLHTLNKPSIYLGEDTILCKGGTRLLNASYPGSTYLWQDGSTGPTLNAYETTAFGVQVSNQCGIDADSIYIEFVDCKCNLFFPKAFTPNQDNKNDKYNFKYDCLEFQSQFRIFNRWGTLVFESNDFLTGWDGTFKGKDAEADAYIYVLKYSGVIDGKIQEEVKRGSFLLFR